MIFTRKIERILTDWKLKSNRKPLILRGGENTALEALRTVPLPNYTYDKLFQLFKNYY